MLKEIAGTRAYNILKKRKMETVEDVCQLFPSKYYDFSFINPLNTSRLDKNYAFVCKLVSYELKKQSSIYIVRCTLQDIYTQNELCVSWFGTTEMYNVLKKDYRPGDTCFIGGKLKASNKKNLFFMSNPIIFKKYDEESDCHIYTAYEKINERSEHMGIVVSAPKSVNYSSMLYRGDPIGNLTVVYDATKLGKFYVPDIKKRNDFALWLKMMHDCKRAYGLNEVLASYRVRAGAISSTRKSELMKYYWKLYRDIENLSNIKASVAMISLVFFKSMRRVNQKIQESINKFRTKQVPGNQTDVKNSSKRIAKIVNGSEDIIFRNTEENAISATVDDVMMSNVIKNKKEGL